MQSTKQLLSLEGRQHVADRLRFIADNLVKGIITPDGFFFDAEWVDHPPLASGVPVKKPSGRITLQFSYWTKAIEDLQ